MNAFRLLFLLPLLLFMNSTSAQLTGEVNYDHLGIRFQIPAGWLGQEMEGGILLGHNSIPGLVLVTLHEHNSLAALQQDARIGINEANGTSLNLASQIQTLDQQTIGGEYAGTIEWTPAKAYALSTLNPHGSGLTVFAAASADAYNDSYRQLALQIKQSIRFSKPDIGDIVNQWKPFLSGMRLTYMDSYYSPSYTDGGVSGGYSKERIIELCSQGGFYYSNNSEMTISGDNVSGYNSGGGEGNGSWRIAVAPDGSPVLRLDFNNGERYEYTLAAPGGELHLDGERNYRTDTEWCR